MDRSPSVDYDSLAQSLAALAYPLRLELLDVLGLPRPLSEIRVRPLRGEAHGSGERAAAKQTVSAHLERLLEAGLLVAAEADVGGRRVTTYAVNPQRLYAITEDLRRLAEKHGGRGRGGDETGTLAAAARPRVAGGPRLVVVHGAYEGRAFPLTDATAVDGAWVIGRHRGLAIALDYDPFVSVENSLVTRRDGE